MRTARFTLGLAQIARMAILGCSAFTLISCATEQTVTKREVKRDGFGREERFTVGKDENGNPVMKSDLRSSMEGKTSHLASNRDFNGKDYTSKSYRKKRWEGNTVFNRKQYGGNIDANRYKQEPWFVRKQASASGQKAYADGKAYAVNSYKKSSAYEQGKSPISRPSDAETDVRRRVYKQPEITHWKEQNGLSINDTNRRLGR